MTAGRALRLGRFFFGFLVLVFFPPHCCTVLSHDSRLPTLVKPFPLFQINMTLFTRLFTLFSLLSLFSSTLAYQSINPPLESITPLAQRSVAVRRRFLASGRGRLYLRTLPKPRRAPQLPNTSPTVSALGAIFLLTRLAAGVRRVV